MLLQGPEEYVAGRVFELVRGKVKEREDAVEVTRFDASTYQRGELLLAASPSLFGEAKVIEVRALATMNEDFLEDALAYATAPADDVVVVCTIPAGTAARSCWTSCARPEPPWWTASP